MHKTAVQFGVENSLGIEADFDYLVTAPTERPHHIESPESPPKDFFIERNGTRYAGTHLIVDLWDAERLDDIDHIERAMRDCVAAAGATLLHIHLHHFTPNLGVSGVAVLAESHISVHTWPETGFAAFDVFMCGDTEPQKAIDVLKSAFRPSRVEVGEHLRGRME
jgi:S-adenosylmethionine decarboxylase